MSRELTDGRVRFNLNMGKKRDGADYFKRTLGTGLRAAKDHATTTIVRLHKKIVDSGELKP